MPSIRTCANWNQWQLCPESMDGKGATAGIELYQEAKLMQAAEAVQKKNHIKSLTLLIEQSKEYPEHLGSGKPYDADIDTRLEDWMSYLNYQYMGNQEKANAALTDIITYSNTIDGAENANAPNAIISL